MLEKPADHVVDILSILEPLTYPGLAALNGAWVATFLQRVHAASYKPPEYLERSVLSSEGALRIISDARDCLMELPNVVDVFVHRTSTAHIVGDLHGHVHDLLSIVYEFGWPSEHRIYIFDGDFIDRGAWGMEVLLILFVLKLCWPKSVHLLRGNHEYFVLMRKYGFMKEVLCKYNKEVWNGCVDALKWCPIAAVVSTFVTPPADGKENSVDDAPAHRKSLMPENAQHTLNKNCTDEKESGVIALETENQSLPGQETDCNQPETEGGTETWRLPLRPCERRVLVLHGGLFRAVRDIETDAPDGRSEFEWVIGDLEDLVEAPRWDGREPVGIISHAVWSDPTLTNPTLDDVDMEMNVRRGRGYLYGPIAVEKFLKRNRLHGIVRAHECPGTRKQRPEMPSMDLGWSVDMKLENKGFVCTVFSASNYPMFEPKGNPGAVATIKGGTVLDYECSFLPEFTTLEIPKRPEEMKLFYMQAKQKTKH